VGREDFRAAIEAAIKEFKVPEALRDRIVAWRQTAGRGGHLPKIFAAHPKGRAPPPKNF
jgi:hypothetical protein